MPVMKNPPRPGTPEWRGMITASKAPAMVRYPEGHENAGEYLGCDYFSAFERWHMMNGTWSEDIDADKQAMFDDAHDAEDYAANVWLRANPGWQLNNGEIAYHDPEWRIDGEEVPHCVTLDRRARRGSRRAIIECKRPRKNNGVQDNWWIQVILQMGISGIHEAYIVIVPVYGTPEIHTVEWDEVAFSRIKADCEAFYLSLLAGEPPAVGDSEHAKEIFDAMHPDPSGETVEVPVDLMDALLTAYDRLAAAEKEEAEARNAVMEFMGDASRAEYEGQTVAKRSTGKFAQSRIPEEDKHLLTDPDLMSPKFDAGKLKKRYPEVHAAAQGAGSFTFERKAWQ